MKIEMRGNHIPLTEAIRSHIERRLHFTLSRFDGWVESVTVRIADVNGPRGGIDKRCQIVAHLTPSHFIVVEMVDSDLYVAIDLAASRLSRAVRRQIERVKQTRGHHAARHISL